VPKDSNKKSILTEDLYFNTTGKLFLASLGAWMVGKYVNTKLKGNRDEISAVANALMSSRKFQEELNRPGASVESVMQKMRVKEMSASTFERVFGIKWPL
jgi:uncharacterized protein YacL (UPF0231 family)